MYKSGYKPQYGTVVAPFRHGVWVSPAASSVIRSVVTQRPARGSLQEMARLKSGFIQKVDQ